MKYEIRKPNEAVYNEIKERWDRVAKPLDGLGVLEELVCRIGAIRGTADPRIDRRAAVVFCADNGIVEEGVSQCGQEVSAEVAGLMGRGKSSIGPMAAVSGVDVLPVDIGLLCEDEIPGVQNRKVSRGTADFLKEPAMTAGECEQAIRTGIDLAAECSAGGYDIIAAGELGIGNTTTAAAVCALMLDRSAQDVVGRGAGLSDQGLKRKEAVVAQAIRTYAGIRQDPFEILRSVGGLDIAGMTGLFIGGAIHGIPVVIDGAISAAAALCAERLAPGCVDCMLPSHMGREGVCAEALGMLGLWLMTPINGDLALGEGTGAVLLFPMLDAALALYREGTRFEGSGIEQYERFGSQGR